MSVYNRMCLTWNFRYCLLEISFALNALPASSLKIQSRGWNERHQWALAAPYHPGRANWVAQLEKVYTTVLVLAHHLIVWFCLSENSNFTWKISDHLVTIARKFILFVSITLLMAVAGGIIKYSYAFKILACGLNLFEIKLVWLGVYLLKPEGMLLRYCCALWEKAWVYA